MAAPLPVNESERLLAIRRYAVLDTPPEVAFDRITRLASRLLNVPIVLVTITDQERNWFKSACGTDVPETSRDLSFCAHAILTDEPTVVADLRRDRRFASNALVTGQPHIRFYAGAPLRTSDGFNLGTLCALDLQPRELTSNERALLKDLAAIVMDELDLRLAVSDRILKEKALQQSYDRLKELEDLRDNLTSMIVHDMRSPLCATMGFLELLRDAAEGKLNEEDISYIESASDSAKELNAMITSLLDVKRLEAGEMPLRRVVSDLRDVAKAAIRPFAELVGKSRLILEAPREAVQTLCDPAIVSRVIANLVNNALKFSPNDGRVRVIIAQEGGRARLSVRDSGSGISIEHHAKIFEKFGQVTGHQTEHSTGLGLTFCKLAIETHGGSIGVESELGQGSNFWFLLPGPPISDCIPPP